MNLPKKTTRYCPFCKKRTEQSIDLAKQKGRSATHPLSRGSTKRLKARGLRSGMGNKGKYSKPAIKSWKRKTKTTTRKVVIYKCDICKKSKQAKNSRRVSKIIIGDKKIA